MATIVGREAEIDELNHIMESDEAKFLVVYGRRRVGKTFLINEYFSNNFRFKVTGLALDRTLPNYNQEQLTNFAKALNAYGYPPCGTPSSWSEAFSMLRTLLESDRISARKRKNGSKRVIFIDELPYLHTSRNDLLSALEHFWNGFANTQSDLVLIVCGSATSWITKRLLRGKGGLYGRVTDTIYIHPFTLAETRRYMQSKELQFDDYSILECYMVMGGIPYYLSFLRKGLSMAQNIDRIFFMRKSPLEGEFSELYENLFTNYKVYMKVVEALSRKRMGMTRAEISEHTGISMGGTLTEILSDLDTCDIIRKYNYPGNKTKNALYQLTDPFTLFWYEMMEGATGREKPYWIHVYKSHRYSTWAGLAFEMTCLLHLPQVERAIGISDVLSDTYAWRSDNAQIDLVIDRSDRIVDLCEIKFWREPFVINESYRRNLENKIASYREETGTSKQVHLVMITTQGVKKNSFSGIVQREVTLKDLFWE